MVTKEMTKTKFQLADRVANCLLAICLLDAPFLWRTLFSVFSCNTVCVRCGCHAHCRAAARSCSPNSRGACLLVAVRLQYQTGLSRFYVRPSITCQSPSVIGWVCVIFAALCLFVPVFLTATPLFAAKHPNKDKLLVFLFKRFDNSYAVVRRWEVVSSLVVFLAVRVLVFPCWPSACVTALAWFIVPAVQQFSRGTSRCSHCAVPLVCVSWPGVCDVERCGAGADAADLFAAGGLHHGAGAADPGAALQGPAQQLARRVRILRAPAHGPCRPCLFLFPLYDLPGLWLRRWCLLQPRRVACSAEC